MFLKGKGKLISRENNVWFESFNVRKIKMYPGMTQRETGKAYALNYKTFLKLCMLIEFSSHIYMRSNDYIK